MALGDTHKDFRPGHQHDQHKLDHLEESLNSSVTIGEVTAVNKENMTITAKCFAGEITGIKAFVLAQGSAHFKQWIPPVTGDKILLISDNGDFNSCYALPIRLASSFDSDIPDGSIIRAGDLTIQYNRDDEYYKITYGDRSIKLNGSEILLEDGSSKITITNGSCVMENGSTKAIVDGSKAQIERGTNKIYADSSKVSAQSGAGAINLTSGTCTISVPGGTMAIAGASFTFNGKAVLLAP